MNTTGLLSVVLCQSVKLLMHIGRYITNRNSSKESQSRKGHFINHKEP